MSNSKITCVEAFHPNDPSCTRFNFFLFFRILKSSLKVFLPFYAVGGIISKGKNLNLPKFAKQLIIDSARSSLFVGVQSIVWARTACAFKELSGAHYKINYFIAAVIASFFAISVEKESRRKELAVYVTNQTSEAIFRMLVARGLKPVPHGLTILFSISMGFLLYIKKRNPDSMSKNIKGMLSFSLGDEQKPDIIERYITPFLPNNSFGTTISGFIRSFTLGASLRLLLFVASFALKGFKTKEKLRNILKSSTRIGIWLGAMNGVYRLVKNILNEWRGKDSAWHHLVGGIIGGTFFAINESVEIGMYVSSKAGEALLEYLVAKRKMKPLPFGSTIIYILGASALLFISLTEPENIRPSYLSFMSRVSGQSYPSMLAHFDVVRRTWKINNEETRAEVLKRLEKLRK